jgi:serine/threonine protein kinase
MSTVFISYAHADAEFAGTLTTALETAGIAVWFDDQLTPADLDFRKRILAEIERADSVIVLWSKSSIESQWVMSEAELARSSGKLLQVRLDGCRLPLPFSALLWRDLPGWTGDVKADAFQKLVSAIVKIRDTKKRLPEDPETVALRAFLKDGLRIELVEHLAVGDISTIYLGRRSWRRYAVKVIHETVHDHADLDREMSIVAQLYNPSFLRIIDVRPRGRDTVIVADYAPAQSVDSVLVERRNQGHGPFSADQAVDIVRQISEALAEAHYRGLRFTRVSPREIFLLQDHTLQQYRVLLSPINFAYRQQLAGAGRRIDFTTSRGPYTAPEILEQGSPLASDDWRETLQKADQFSLGMLAWTLLEGRCIFDAERGGESAFVRTSRFLESTYRFSNDVMSAPWRTRAPALARIISRMLQRDPAARWSDMREVSQLLGAIDADHDGEELRNRAKALHAKHCRNGDGSPNCEFYRRFYSRLFELDPPSRAAFGDNFNFDRQYITLDAALGMMLNYNEAQDEPTPLTSLAMRHKAFVLAESSYTAFGEALIETFGQFLPDDDQLQLNVAALEIVIWPAIYYFIERTRSP